MTMINLDKVRAQHAKVVAALLALENPNSERYRVLTEMRQELEADIPLLEYARVMEMAARLVDTGRVIGDVRESHGLRENVQPHTRARGKR